MERVIGIDIDELVTAQMLPRDVLEECEETFISYRTKVYIPQGLVIGKVVLETSNL